MLLLQAQPQLVAVTLDPRRRRHVFAGEMLERIGYMLIALADYLALIIEKLREFGNYLINTARSNGAVNSSTVSP